MKNNKVSLYMAPGHKQISRRNDMHTKNRIADCWLDQVKQDMSHDQAGV